MPTHCAQPPNGRVWFALAALLIAAGAIASNSAMHASWMLALNQTAQVVPDIIWSCLTVSGLGWAVLILVSVMSRNDLGARVVLSGFIMGALVTHAIKPLLSMPRPGVVLPTDVLHFIGNPVINYHSMPSGHTVAALCMGSLWVCLIRSHAYPRWTEWLAWIIAASIAASRVAVGAHWPADVLVGAGLGLMVGWLAWRFPFAWPRAKPRAFPWVPVLVEGLGAWAAFSLNEGMPLALYWQYLLGATAVSSIVWRIYVWRSAPTTQEAA